MTADDKLAALTIAAQHALGGAHVAITPARLAKVMSFLDVDEEGIVRVFGGKVEANHAAYAVVPTPWEPRVHWDIMGGGKDLPVTFAKLVEDLKLAKEL
jgi:hypothetical protein